MNSNNSFNTLDLPNGFNMAIFHQKLKPQPTLFQGVPACAAQRSQATTAQIRS